MPTDAQYRRLLSFRTRLREFEHWSREAAAEHGVTHTQHQLLLAIRGRSADGGTHIGDVAESLLIRHHTATELVDRAAQLDLVVRERDPADSRKVLLRLTDRGEEVLRGLTAAHLEELRRLPVLLEPLEG